jgi:pimeloyl-ACP methyl ester carboxylesterase
VRSTGTFGEDWVRVAGTAAPTRFLHAGQGPPLVLLHADGENRLDWRWVVDGLASRYEVFAPDLPGFDGAGRPPDCSPGYFEGFVHGFLDALDLDRVSLVGSSLGGVAALRVALRDQDRVEALCLVGPAGLGTGVSPAMRQLTLPGVGEVAVGWSRTAVGAVQRALLRVPLLFANPVRVPPAWLAEQRRLARLPGFLDTALAALRGQVGPCGQRHVLVGELPRLRVPTLLVWGERDLVVPLGQGRAAARLLPRGELATIPGAGHLPHVERPDEFLAAVSTLATPDGGR